MNNFHDENPEDFAWHEYQQPLAVIDEVEANNILIAEFMGFKRHEHFPQQMVSDFLAFPTKFKRSLISHLNYHSSANWLHSVIAKIETLGMYICYESLGSINGN